MRLLFKNFCRAAVLSTSWPLRFANAATITSRQSNQTDANTYDYIVVGSGPGGGPLAARLAQAGHSVLLIDAGEDHGTDQIIQIPLFQAAASEYTPIHWQFFVSHYDNVTRAQQDSKFTWETPDGNFHTGPNPPAGSQPLGIYYPRTGTLGGCAQHNALVMTYPARVDFDIIASATGDSSWSADNMRQYWAKLENNEYMPEGTKGYGFSGWMDTSLTDLRIIARDTKMISLLQATASVLGKGLLGTLFNTVTGLAQALTVDFNNDSPNRDTKTGMYQVPLSVTTSTRSRSSQRKLILDTANAVNANGSKKYNLKLQLNTLVTRVIFDTTTTPGTPRAVGVEYLTGRHLYRADPLWRTGAPAGSGQFFARREVILAGGVFNTPQLLKLSGIGAAAELAQHNIPLILNSPAVGTNMQDRYEVGVVGKASSDFSTVKNCTFLQTPDDPCYLRWRDNPTDKGIYGTNGVAVGIIHSTSVAEPTGADMFVGGVGTNFKGYYPGYSVDAGADIRHWTWLVLKAHSRNNAGTVKLRSADPRDTPLINFRSFDVGGEQDLQAVYEGVQMARRIFERALPIGGTFAEEVPGPAISSEAAVKQWIRDEAWGHHASCTVPIGAANDPNTVLDSRFRVKGVSGLRVVDASVFPKIPGFYIVGAVYMISEKAAAVIIEDAQNS